jgi:hypothetical protein
MENPTRSGFFIGRVNVGFMYVGAFSCGLEGKAKTPAEKAEQVRPRRSVCDEEAHRPPAESEVLSLARKPKAMSQAVPTSSFLPFADL